jgi:hypothetical protein
VLTDYWKEKPLRIERILSSSVFLEYATLDTTYVATNGLRVHSIKVYAVLAPGWPIGPVDEKLVLYTNHPDYKEVVIGVRGEVKGPVQVSPGIVRLAPQRRGQQFSRTITLKSATPLVIGKVTSSSEALVSQVQLHDDGHEATIIVSDTVPLHAKNAEGLYWEAIYIDIVKPTGYKQAVRLWGPIIEDNPATGPATAIASEPVLPYQAATKEDLRDIAAAREAVLLDKVMKLLVSYVRAHGTWPDDISAVLPVAESAGLIYMKPAVAEMEAKQAPVLYRKFDTWPGQEPIGFSDGSVRVVRNNETFGSLVKPRVTSKAFGRRGE